MQLTDWLEEHGILVTSLLAENFNAGWLIRAVQEVGGRLHGQVTFVVITFIFTALGLLEVGIARKNIESLSNKEAARTILQASTQIADKFRRPRLSRKTGASFYYRNALDAGRVGLVRRARLAPAERARIRVRHGASIIEKKARFYWGIARLIPARAEAASKSVRAALNQRPP